MKQSEKELTSDVRTKAIMCEEGSQVDTNFVLEVACQKDWKQCHTVSPPNELKCPAPTDLLKTSVGLGFDHHYDTVLQAVVEEVLRCFT